MSSPSLPTLGAPRLYEIALFQPERLLILVMDDIRSNIKLITEHQMITELNGLVVI